MGTSRKGRKAGVPNKVTADVRAAIAVFAAANVESMQQWIATVAEGDPRRDIKADPGKALDLYLRALEYHIPKLARSEITGKDGGNLTLTVSVADVSVL